MQYDVHHDVRHGSSAQQETGPAGASAGEVLMMLWHQPLRPSASAQPDLAARWWLAFGWPMSRRDIDDDPWVRRVALDGVRPPALWRLRLSVADDAVIDLGAVSDGRGGLIAAGELVASMGFIAGYDGLTMDLSTEREAVRARDVRVQLWLLEPQPDCRVRLLRR